MQAGVEREKHAVKEQSERFRQAQDRSRHRFVARTMPLVTCKERVVEGGRVVELLRWERRKIFVHCSGGLITRLRVQLACFEDNLVQL